MSERHELAYLHNEGIDNGLVRTYHKQLCVYSTNLRYKLIICVLLVVMSLELLFILVVFTRSRNCHCPENETDTGTTPSVVPMQKADENRNVTEPEPINSLCFPCAEVGRNITNNDTGDIIKLDKKTNMCCMEDVGNLKKLFLLIINEYYRNVISGASTKHQGIEAEASNPTKTEDQIEDVAPVAGHQGGSGETKAPPTPVVPDFWTKREVAAHMFLDNKLLKSSNITAPRIPWNGHDYHNLSMTSEQLVYRPETRSIQIKQSGLYFVYSSITLQAPSTDLNAQVYHMLLREHYQLPKTGQILMTMNKYGGGIQSSGFYTSFLCGVFKLRVDEDIFVRVSNVSFVYKFYYSNYLGLYRLSRA